MTLPVSLWSLGAILAVLVTVACAGYPAGCKESLKTCLDQLPPILSRSQSELKGIPTSVEELNTICLAFNTGMACVDNFTIHCLDKLKQQWVENTVAGARATFQMLCRNKDFRSQYLLHSRCFRMSSVTEGWDSCAGRFVSIVQEEMARENPKHGERVIELCCAKHGFIKCVYGMARHKCGSSSAVFLRRIAETLGSVRVENKVCNAVNYTYCSAAATTATASSTAVIALLLGLALCAGLVRR